MTVEEAERLAASSFGMKVRAKPLGSQQDSNFLLLEDGAPAGLLKIANPAFSRTEIEAQDAAAICDRMLELGVVIQPTSDRMRVLKIKPPLCLDTAGADFFADALDRVLTEGW